MRAGSNPALTTKNKSYDIFRFITISRSCIKRHYVQEKKRIQLVKFQLVLCRLAIGNVIATFKRNGFVDMYIRIKVCEERFGLSAK